MKRTRRNFLALLAGATQLSASIAFALDRPKGKVLLTVEGNIEHTNASAGRQAQFDLAMLDALRQVSFRTSTIWTEGTVKFSGPPLQAVLDSVGRAHGQITAYAVNDYNIGIDPGTMDDRYPIIATRMNGETFSLRNRGPLWLVYPYDSDAKFKDKTIFAQSIWQLHCLKVD